MATVLVGEVPALELHVTMPQSGAWTASGKLDTSTAPTGAATITCDGGLTLSGTVLRSGVFLDSAYVWIVGGAGKLAATVSGSFTNAQAGDVLDQIAAESGEVLSDTIAAELRSVSLPLYTLGGASASSALDSLAVALAASLGEAVVWRVLPNGKIWIGSETWPTATLPATDEIRGRNPDLGRVVIGTPTPSLAPGVNLSDVGNVRSVEHWVERSRIRTWAWT